MNDIVVLAVSGVTRSDLASAQLGGRFGRLDLISQLALLAVEPLAPHFDSLPRERIGICIAVRAGSLSTDVEYWKDRDATGGPSPMLFTYTLPSSAIGEIAIRHRLTGPNLCFVGSDDIVLSEAADWLRRADVDGCVCVSCDVVTPPAAEVIQETPATTACALFLARGSNGLHALREIDRDMKLLCDKIRSQNPACPK